MNKMEPLTSTELLNVLRLAKLESDRDHAMLLICYGHAMRQRMRCVRAAAPSYCELEILTRFPANDFAHTSLYLSPS